MIGRAIANAIAGGVLLGIGGAVCLGLAGTLAAALLSGVPASDAHWFQGTFLGAILGLALGALSGALIFAVAALRSAPDAPNTAVAALFGRTIRGQFAGTALACLAYLAWTAVAARGHFSATVGDNINLLLYGAPALMIGGAIVAALRKR